MYKSPNDSIAKQIPIPAINNEISIEKKLAEMKFLSEFTKESNITLADAQELGRKVGKSLTEYYASK